MDRSRIRAAYVSYADFGGPLVHTREFARAFAELVDILALYCPYLDQDLEPGRPGRESFFNRLFGQLPTTNLCE